jgi:hypothetical protein
VRIVVADGFAPFLDERSDGPAAELVSALRARGHEVELIRIPRGGDAARTELAARLTDVSDAGELLLAVGRPAHLLRHPRKVIWCEGEAFARADSVDSDRAAFAEARTVIAASPPAREAVRGWWDGDLRGEEEDPVGMLLG